VSEKELAEIERFMAEAWCIDGEIQSHTISISGSVGWLHEMTDSKRGRFGCIMLLPEEVDLILGRGE
jgi:hypothetical protein